MENKSTFPEMVAITKDIFDGETAIFKAEHWKTIKAGLAACYESGYNDALAGRDRQTHCLVTSENVISVTSTPVQ